MWEREWAVLGKEAISELVRRGDDGHLASAQGGSCWNLSPPGGWRGGCGLGRPLPWLPYVWTEQMRACGLVRAVLRLGAPGGLHWGAHVFQSWEASSPHLGVAEVGGRASC